MNNRILKAFAPLVLASLLIQTPAAFALQGGPFDGGHNPGASAAGTYVGIMTGKNLLGMCQFGISETTESDGRFTVFHEGIMSYGVCQGVADPSNQRIAASLLGLAALPGETGNSASVTSQNAIQTFSARGSAEGFWTAEMKGFPVAITFEGKGEVATAANPSTVTTGTNGAGPTVTITAPGTADGVGGGDPSIVQVDTTAEVFSTTLRATTPFEVRGSRTSLTGFSSLNSFSASAQTVPGNP